MKKNRILLGLDIAAGIVAAVSAVWQYLRKEKHEIIKHAASFEDEESKVRKKESGVT